MALGHGSTRPRQLSQKLEITEWGLDNVAEQKDMTCLLCLFTGQRPAGRAVFCTRGCQVHESTLLLQGPGDLGRIQRLERKGAVGKTGLGGGRSTSLAWE